MLDKKLFTTYKNCNICFNILQNILYKNGLTKTFANVLLEYRFHNNFLDYYQC